MLRLLGGGLFCCGFQLAILGIIFAGLWKTFEKMGKPGWMGIIPVYNIIVMLEVIRKPVWWIVFFLIPFVGPILVGLEVAKCFAKDSGFGVGLGLLPFVFYPILGFGSARFVGPEGGPVSGERGEADYEERPARRSRRFDDEADQITSERPMPAAPPPPAAAASGTVTIQCTGCQRRLKVPVTVVGKKVKCPACAATFLAG